MDREFSDILCGTAPYCDYTNINLLLPDYGLISSLENEEKKFQKEQHIERTNQELAGLTLQGFRKLYKRSPNFKGYKTLRRRGQKSQNNYHRRKTIKKIQLMKEIYELKREIQRYRYLLQQEQYHC